MANGTCPRCGSDVSADANFCSTCGFELASQDDRTERHSVVVVDTDEVGMLVVTRGGAAGSRYALSGPVVAIGRHPEAGVFLDDVSVSRRHAEVRVGRGGYTLADLGSLNGTYLNGTRIEAEASLAEGDQIQVGKFKLVFVIGGRHDG